MPDVSGHNLNSDVLACIEVCSDCHRACLQTAIHCMQVGGAHAEAKQVRVMLDCAQICQTSADFMLRGSDLHAHTCSACAAVCQRCAEACGRLGRRDPRLAACAEQCRRCAESCGQMAQSHADTTARTARSRAGSARSNIRGIPSRSKETNTWKPKTITPPTARTASTARKSPSSLKTVSNRSS